MNISQYYQEQVAAKTDQWLAKVRAPFITVSEVELGDIENRPANALFRGDLTPGILFRVTLAEYNKIEDLTMTGWIAIDDKDDFRVDTRPDDQ